MGTTGFDQLAAAGVRNAEQKSAHKQALSDEDLHRRASEFTESLKAKQAKIPAYLDEKGQPKLGLDGQPVPEYQHLVSGMQQDEKDLRQLYHPENNPGALEKFGHLLTDAFHITKPTPTETMVVHNPKGLIEGGNINIWERPTVQNDDGSHSSELSISMQDGQGREVLIPTIADGKFLTPDGKKPPGPVPTDWSKASPEWQALRDNAWKHYEETGQHLGKFATPADADKYAQMLHNRGPAPKSIQKQETKEAADKKAAEGLAAAAPMSPQQTAVAEAEAASASALTTVNNSFKMLETLRPDLKGAELQGMKDQIIQHALGIADKPNLKLYTLPDGTKAWLDATRPDLIPPGSTASGTENADTRKRADYAAYVKDHPEYENQGGNFERWAAQQGAIGRTGGALKFNAATGQVQDLTSGKQYSESDPSNPPEVAAMFKSMNAMAAKKQAFQLKLASIRGSQYNMTKPMIVLDTANGNAPAAMTFGEMLKNPTRYMPAVEADKALAKENLMADIAGTSKLTRNSINDMEDFPEEMKAKIVLAMKADDPHAALDQLIASGAVGSLTDKQQNFLIATRQLAENAMAMRTILGAGQGSEDMRNAIRETLPGLLSPDKSYALRQLDAFDNTIQRLHRGVPKVQLRTDLDGGASTNVAPKGATHKTEYPKKSGNWFYVDKDGNNLGPVPK
jgi:hypothetical protein